MSEVRNVTSSLTHLMEKYASGPLSAERRAEIIDELSEMTGEKSFRVVEGSLMLEVPYRLVLEHVEGSLLIQLVLAVNDYARILVRAAATGPGEVLGNWLDKRPFDEPGQFLELLDNGGVRFVPLHLASDDGADDMLVEEGTSAGVVRHDAPGDLLNDGIGAIAHRGLIHGQSNSLDHPDPLVPRRTSPPP